jgi:hypothetical protein
MANSRRRNRRDESSEEAQTVDTQATDERDPIGDALDEAFGLPPRKRWANAPRRTNDVHGATQTLSLNQKS